MSDFEWKQVDPSLNMNTKVEPLSKEEEQGLDSYAELVLSTLRRRDPRCGYDLPTVKLLSDSLNAERSGYTEAQNVQIANMYGAFLGKAILTVCKHLNSSWVRSNDSIGVCVKRDSGMRIAFPITRVFKQIDEGEAASMFELFARFEQFAKAEFI